MVRTAVASAYVAAGSTASNVVRVRCERPSFVPNSKISCSGTRPREGGSYHYKIVVNTDGDGISSLDIDSRDDDTGDIVQKR